MKMSMQVPGLLLALCLCMAMPALAIAQDAAALEKAKAYVDQGIRYRMNGDHKKAIEAFTMAINTNPTYAEAYECRAMSYGSGEMRDFDAALVDFNKAIELDQTNPEFYFGRALAYYYKQMYDKCWDDVHHAEGMGFTPPPGFIAELQTVSKRQK